MLLKFMRTLYFLKTQRHMILVFAHYTKKIYVILHLMIKLLIGLKRYFVITMLVTKKMHLIVWLPYLSVN